MICENCGADLALRWETDEEEGTDYQVYYHIDIPADHECQDPKPEPAPHWANDCGNARWTSDATGISTSY